MKSRLYDINVTRDKDGTAWVKVVENRGPMVGMTTTIIKIEPDEGNYP